MPGGVVLAAGFLFVFLIPGCLAGLRRIAAAVHDGQNQRAVGLLAVQHAVALHDLLAEELGIKRRVPADVGHEIIKIVAQKREDVVSLYNTKRRFEIMRLTTNKEPASLKCP